MTNASRILMVAALALGGGLFLAGTEAFACGNGKLFFKDKFETLDPTWNFAPEDPRRSNGPQGLTYKLAPGLSIELNQSILYDSYEVCAVFATEAVADAVPSVSVYFWASDWKNYYVVDVVPKFGTFTVYRIQNDKLLMPVPLTSNDTIHKGTNVTNEISVTVNGKKATLAINGKKVIDFSGQPPEGGSRLIGFQLGTRKKDPGPSTFTVKSIEVREVGTAQPK